MTSPASPANPHVCMSCSRSPRLGQPNPQIFGSITNDLCPKCGQKSMPAILWISVATARACQNPACGHVEEIPRP